ncbi:MAG: tetratricopeptide repeat protein, partial [Candidatus Helarchaeota archaeon]
ANMAAVYDHLGKTERAHELYDEALKLNDKIGNLTLKATILNNLGLMKLKEAETDQSKFDEALSLLEQAIKIDDLLGNLAFKAQRLMNIGAVYRKLGDFDTAIKYYNQALKIDEFRGDIPNKGYTLNNLGLLYSEIANDHETAKKYHEEALEIAMKYEQKQNIMIRSHNVGVDYYNLGDLEKALSFYNKAINLAEELELEHDKANYLGYKGNLFIKKEKYSEAIPIIEESLSISKKHGDKSLIGGQLYNLGLANYRLGNFSEACDLFGEYIEFIKSNKQSPDEIMRGLVDLGNSFYKASRLEECINAYSESLSISKQLNDIEYQKMVLDNITHVLKQLKQYSRAISFYIELLDIAGRGNDDQGIAKTMNQISIMIENEIKQNPDYSNSNLLKDNSILHELIVDNAIDQIPPLHDSSELQDLALKGYVVAARFAEKAKDYPLLANIYNNIGMSYFEAQQYDEAESFFHKKMDAYAKADMTNDEINVFNELIIINKNRGDEKEVISLYKKAIQRSEKAQDLEWLRKFNSELGYFFQSLKDYQNSNIYFEAKLENCKKLNDAGGINSSLQMLGTNYFNAGQRENAIAYFERAVKHARQMGDANLILKNTNNLAYIHRTMDHRDEAISLYEKVVEFGLENAKIEDALSALQSIAMIYFNAGNLAKAIEYLKKEIEPIRQLEDNKRLAQLYLDIGNTYNRGVDSKSAIKYFSLRANVLGEMKDVESIEALAMTHNTIGMVYYNLEDYKNALDSYSDGLRIMNESMSNIDASSSREVAGEVRDLSRELLSAKASLLQNCGTALRQLREFDEAMKNFNASVEINMELKNLSEVAWTHGSISRLFEMKEDMQQAIHFRKKALKIYEDLKDLNMQKSSLNSLFELYEKIGDKELMQEVKRKLDSM